jgi:tungstate transport system substrate-binding protein
VQRIVEAFARLAENRDGGRVAGTTRRGFIELLSVAGVGSLARACRRRTQAIPTPPAAPAASVASAADAVAPPEDERLVRVMSVSTVVDGGLLPDLLAAFEKKTGLRTSLERNDEPYPAARAGKADLVVSHYGHKDAAGFVLEGFGDWPATICSNQMVLLGPPTYPAKTRGLVDAGAAFRRIGEKRAPFVLMPGDGGRYVAEILWNTAGRPNREGWYSDERLEKSSALRVIASRGAYSLWGLTPFLRAQAERPVELEPLVFGDPLLQRLLVSITIRASRVPGVNTTGAATLQSFLLSPETQAHMGTVSYPGMSIVKWMPAGRHNHGGILPKG